MTYPNDEKIEEIQRLFFVINQKIAVLKQLEQDYFAKRGDKILVVPKPVKFIIPTVIKQ